MCDPSEDASQATVGPKDFRQVWSLTLFLPAAGCQALQLFFLFFLQEVIVSFSYQSPQPYYTSVRATPFAFRATQKEVCLYAERLPSFLMLR